MSALCRLARTMIAWLRLCFNHLSPVFDRVWRGLVCLWRCMAGLFRLIIVYPLSALNRPRDPGRNRAEQEIRPEERLSQPTNQVNVEGPEGEGRNDAVIGAQAAGFNREPFGELSEEEEDDEEEEEFDSDKFRVQTSDELYCGYDTTWETEESSEGTLKRPRRAAANRNLHKFRRFEIAARDMHNYRHDYPSQISPQRWTRLRSDGRPNLDFYLGSRPSTPDGVYIDDFHTHWFGQYHQLEYTHTYIQWLFPLQEPGVNDEASPLTKEEVQRFLSSDIAKENLLNSYKLMLDFYGIQLCDEVTGKVKRSPNWRDRFDNLNTHTHNNLRISRILKCQGTLGYTHYQAPLVRFFLEETLINGELPNVKESVLSYFLFAVRDKKQRRKLIKFAYMHYDNKDEFVWCPKKIQMMWSGAVQGHRGNKLSF